MKLAMRFHWSASANRGKPGNRLQPDDSSARDYPVKAAKRAQAQEMEKFHEESREQQANTLLPVETQSCHHYNPKLTQITMQGEHVEVVAEYLIPGGVQRG